MWFYCRIPFIRGGEFFIEPRAPSPMRWSYRTGPGEVEVWTPAHYMCLSWLPSRQRGPIVPHVEGTNKGDSHVRNSDRTSEVDRGH